MVVVVVVVVVVFFVTIGLAGAVVAGLKEKVKNIYRFLECRRVRRCE